MGMKCNKSECSSNATKQVIGLFRSAPRDDPAIADFGLFLCEEHSDVVWDEVITPEGWDEIRASFTKQGFAEPKKGFSKVTTKLISEEE